MKPKSLPSVETLKLLLTYDEITGNIFWNLRDESSFTPTKHKTAQQLCNVWNGKSANKPAFTSQRSDGYFVGSINKQYVLAHRVIYKIIYGVEPDNIDHEDGDTSNNKKKNLISKTHQSNMVNRKLPVNNSTGQLGVYLNKKRNVWDAYIHVNKTRKFMGSFNSFDDAVAARKAAETSNNYHSNHGRIQ